MKTTFEDVLVQRSGQRCCGCCKLDDWVNVKLALWCGLCFTNVTAAKQMGRKASPCPAGPVRQNRTFQSRDGQKSHRSAPNRNRWATHLAELTWSQAPSKKEVTGWSREVPLFCSYFLRTLPDVSPVRVSGRKRMCPLSDQSIYLVGIV